MTPIAPALQAETERLAHLAADYDGLVAKLAALGAGRRAPQVGQHFPGFALPDAAGRFHTLAELLAPGTPLVISFHRGLWCPWCRVESAAWGDAAEALAAAGSRLITISAELAGQGTALATRAGGLGLVDVDLGLCLALGLVISIPAELAATYREGGDDLAALFGGSGRLLPIPATYLLDGGGVVRFAFVDPDFRRRAEPAAVIAALGSA
ncbi:redoxin domain-containing protein [Sandarakinorhabdus sp. AAP62]|uniref:redoxin domain-containing protein n=1 Tax=Sandarakinorhabdus sp. AAP62 TaxID=1248916 RepID=UPI0002E6B961|nr:redoxin domain-containing protein [Sandarakinorhabdus sp. AAP62]